MKNPTLYNMIVQAEDRTGPRSETLIYALLTLSAIVSIGHAAIQPVKVPVGFAAATTVECRA